MLIADLESINSTYFYAACISGLIIILVISLYMRSLLRERDNFQKMRSLELQDIFLTSSLGGYFYWDREENKVVDSINLIKMLHAQEPITDLAALLRYFPEDSSTIMQSITRLLSGSMPSFRLRVNGEIQGKKRNFYSYGSVIHTRSGVAKAVVIWFFDISDFMQRIEETDQQNQAVLKTLKEYRTILNSLPIPTWRSHGVDDPEFHNSAYSRFFGNAVRDENSVAPWVPLARQVLRKKTMLTERRHVVTAGERYLFEITIVPEGKGDDLIGYARDVSIEEFSEKELQRHISAQSDLLESSSSAMAIYGADMQLRFFNNAFVKLWGLDEGWLAGNPEYSAILELLRERRKLPEQADFAAFRKKQLQLFTELTETHNEFFYLPDGRAIRVIVIPHALGGLLFAYEDMTDRLSMERKYNTLIAVQKVTLDNLSEGVALFGADGQLKFHNPIYEQMWPSEEGLLSGNPHVTQLLERNRSQIDGEKNWEEYKKEVMESLNARLSSQTRVELQSGRVLERSAVPLPDGATLVSYLDITDSIFAEKRLRERNEALEEADRIKTEFLANISYELRTPLTSIIGFTEALLSNVFGKTEGKQRDAMQAVSTSANQLLLLIDDILDLASMEAGQVTINPQEIAVDTLLQNISDNIMPRIKDSGLSLTMECAENIGTIEADNQRITQIMIHLLDNAIKFTEAGGNISIGAKGNARIIAIWIEDSGMGIEKSEQGKIFDRFFKSDAARHMNKIGTGLGLPVVKNMILMHGGKVQIKSEVGKGTRVTFYLWRKFIKNKIM